MLVAIIGSIWLAALWLPSMVALAAAGQRSLAQAVRGLWPLWAIQAVAAAALIYLADALGLANPAGYTLAICMAIGCAGALAVGWRCIVSERRQRLCAQRSLDAD